MCQLSRLLVMVISVVIATVSIAITMTTAVAQNEGTTVPTALVNYGDYERLVDEVKQVRPDRLIDFETFLKMSQEPNTVILDTRSREFYNRRHIEGAINLPFTEFTQANLQALIPDSSTRILIYCNNNFADDQINFTSKIFIPEPLVPDASGLSLTTTALAITALDSSLVLQAEQQPIMLALNIPTFINLYGYGYRQVYELNELISVLDDRVTLVSVP